MRWGIRITALLAVLGFAVSGCGERHATAQAYASQATAICACKDMVCVKATSESFQKQARAFVATMPKLEKADRKLIHVSVKKTEECVKDLKKKKKKGAPAKP